MKWQFRKEHIPNYLTILRIILVPIIVILLLVNSPIAYSFKIWSTYYIAVNVTTIVANCLFIIACLTDALDGYLARRYRWVTKFGKFWDPLADKILVNSVLFCLASSQQNLLPIWIPIIILIRDIIVDGLRLNANTSSTVIAANIYGKIKTVCLMMGIIYLLFLGSTEVIVGPLYYWLIQNFLMYCATILSIVSGLVYGWQWIKSKKDQA